MHTYDFRKKAILAMKSRYLKVTGCGTHSGDPLTGSKDISAVDCLVVKLYQEMQLAIDKDEAAHHEAAMWKAQKQAVSNILVPPPHPFYHLIRTIPHNNLHPSFENDAPSLEEEMAAIVTPKVTKR